MIYTCLIWLGQFFSFPFFIVSGKCLKCLKKHTKNEWIMCGKFYHSKKKTECNNTFCFVYYTTNKKKLLSLLMMIMTKYHNNHYGQSSTYISIHIVNHNIKFMHMHNVCVCVYNGEFRWTTNKQTSLSSRTEMAFKHYKKNKQTNVMFVWSSLLFLLSLDKLCSFEYWVCMRKC